METTPTLVVFGGGGQLGRALAALPPPLGWRRLDIPRDRADITDAAAVAAALAGIEAGLVVNAAAFTAVDRAEAEAEAAFRVNRDGAANVAAAAAARGLACLHVSTDYVFDGAKRAPYVETDATAPLSVYGASKLAGELAVAQAASRHVILRTSWLFGAEGRNFARTILGLARCRDELGIVDDQLGCPTAAGDLAAAILAMAPRLAEAPAGDPAFGLFHCCGDRPVTWYGFAQAVLAEAAALGIKVARLRPITTADYPLPARRPPYSVLSTTRLAAVHGIDGLNWRRAVGEYVPRYLAEG